ncbi:hypothetical protein MHYP_G00272380 [Metynnis hypsauchen]
MTPAVASAMTISKKHLPLNNKLRKPVLEKMRRDHINSSIEKLKTLLTPEFLNQQPDSKLDLGVDEEVKTQSQRKLLNHFQNLQPSTEEKWRESDLPLLYRPTDHQQREEFRSERPLEVLVDAFRMKKTAKRIISEHRSLY